MSKIHPSAIISSGAELAEDVAIGPYSVVEDTVKIGKGTIVGSSVLLASGAVLGEDVRISHGAVIGTKPQDLKFGGEITSAIVGDRTVVREYATINRGTKASGETRIGSDCLLMAYSHTAHDCHIGNNVIMANSVNLAGHIEIADHVIIGGVVPVHQFVKIGTHAMVGGGFRVPQDVCPFALVGGYPLKVMGVNVIGLRRRSFTREVLKHIEKVFKLLFFSGLNTSQAVEKIQGELEITAETQTILDFIESSERGMTK